ncbi:MAG: hypothetical protein RLZZ480_740 [Candidatus Parcubacteria bacterium]|jgi:membrane protein DedA with SNARE-associated domain
MFTPIETFVFNLINVLPLKLFVLVGSFIEEVIAPVPALAVMLATGSAAQVQGLSVLDLIPLALIAASGKTVGAALVYYITGYAGEFVLTKFGWLFKVSAEEVEALGQKLTGDKKDYLLLTAIRALPIIPSSVVSLGCGLLQIPFKLFIITTFIGTIVRDGIFLYVGYSGITILHQLATRSTDIESYLQTLFIAVVFAGFGYLYYKRSKKSSSL